MINIQNMRTVASTLSSALNTQRFDAETPPTEERTVEIEEEQGAVLRSPFGKVRDRQA